MNPDKNKWTAKRIAALAGVILLLAMYGSTLVIALIGGPDAGAYLMGSIYLTIAVPILLYGMSLVAKNVRGRGNSSASMKEDNSDDSIDSSTGNSDDHSR
jgi:hypothetical protein